MLTMLDIQRAINCPDTLAAAQAYSGLRAALTLTDDMRAPVLYALMDRALEASHKYPDDGGRAQAAENAVLRAYAEYIRQVLKENFAAKRSVRDER